MTMPDYVCQTICAGLNIIDLLDGAALLEPPEEPIEVDTPQINNPHMNSEEGLHLNNKRYGFDERVTEKQLTESVDFAKDYSGHYECETAAPKIETCLERGGEVAHWLTERIINPDSFCDYDTGNCTSLFGEAK